MKIYNGLLQLLDSPSGTFVITQIVFDLAEKRISLTVNKTDSEGVVHTEVLSLSGSDADAFLAAAPQPNDTLYTLGVNTSQAAVKTHYNIIG